MSNKTHRTSVLYAHAGVRRAARAALAAGVLCALAALPASTAGAASVSGSASTSEPAEASAAVTLNVEDLSGKAAELLHRLTIPQLAPLLGVTPEQLVGTIEHSSGRLLGTIEALLANPKASLQEVLDLLAENGVSTEQVQQAIAPLVASATETGEQLHSVITSALTDLRENGALPELAHELTLPAAVLEGAQLVTGTAQQAASALGTNVSDLTSVLEKASAIAQPLSAVGPVVVQPLERVSQTGTTLVVGSPTGAGGVTLTTVHSSAPASPGGVAGFKATTPASVSNAFSILSIKVTRSGAILEKVRVPGPGRLSVAASATKTVARRSAHTRARSRTVKVAAAALSTSGGTLTVTLRPRGVNAAQRTRVTLSTTYSPTGGSPRTLKRFVTLPRRRSARHG